MPDPWFWEDNYVFEHPQWNAESELWHGMDQAYRTLGLFTDQYWHSEIVGPVANDLAFPLGENLEQFFRGIDYFVNYWGEVKRFLDDLRQVSQ